MKKLSLVAWRKRVEKRQSFTSVELHTKFPVGGGENLLIKFLGLCFLCNQMAIMLGGERELIVDENQSTLAILVLSARLDEKGKIRTESGVVYGEL